ncbi:MAG TPA: thioredoxin-like domain-containing protein [Pyrinomonadaceae bacterium]|nr:thioredoxin-like domain-containing protein [Pyrinomonadaceae bacterium]
MRASLAVVSLLAAASVARVACVAPDVGAARAEPVAGRVASMSLGQKGRVRAPELEGGRGWLNTERPLQLSALRGKVVLLDFWTYGCINCVHIIPDLQRLEAKYARELVVIGVHSAKFSNERETENIRRIVLRYGVEHPVVNDADFRIWESYAVRAWPTQVLIDAEGYVVGRVSGEGHYEVLDETIGKLAADARAKGKLDERPLKLALESAKTADLPLAFPGKVLADERAGRLFIADSNHNRVVVTTLEGKLIETIGTGGRGAADGRFDRATFNRPQGLALDGDALYIADTSNHLIRRADLKTRTVVTIAGTGRQALGPQENFGPALRTSLASPWDVLVSGRALYVAMAGPHQIWKLDLDRQEVSVFAGSGREARLDGARGEAAFAQPSGLATDGRTLFVADSESNIIRAVRLREGAASAGSKDADDGEEVVTLAGGDLFEFGDREGRGDEVRLQHPLGVVFHEGAVLIADTYNHKLKRLDPATRAVETLAGTGRAGQRDGADGSFYEPGGLSVARGRVYVADTNNHAVRVVDLRTRQVSTLRIEGLSAPEGAGVASAVNGAGDAAEFAPNAEERALAPQRVAAGSDAELILEVALPEGFHLNPAAPHRVRVTVERGAAHVATAGEGGASAGGVAGAREYARSSRALRLPVRVPLRTLAAGEAELRAQLTLFYCREDNTGTCRVKTLVWRAPVRVVADDAAAPREVRARASVE